MVVTLTRVRSWMSRYGTPLSNSGIGRAHVCSPVPPAPLCLSARPAARALARRDGRTSGWQCADGRAPPGWREASWRVPSMRGAREGLALYGLGIAAGTAIECPGNPADGSDADPRALVDVAVRHALEQQRHHPPAIGHGLEFGRRAQVLEERSHVLCPVERSQRLRQGLHGGLDIAFRQGFWALFHPHSMY